MMNPLPYRSDSFANEKPRSVLLKILSHLLPSVAHKPLIPLRPSARTMPPDSEPTVSAIGSQAPRLTLPEEFVLMRGPLPAATRTSRIGRRGSATRHPR